MLKIGVIGAGNLASALIRGLGNRRRGVYDIYVTDIDRAKAESLAKALHVRTGTTAELAARMDVLVLAVKPANIPGLLQELKALPAGQDRARPLIISVAAGLSLAYYQKQLPEAAMVRAMPNTSSSTGRGMTGLARGIHVTEAQAAAADDIFQAVGQTLWIADEKMNILTAVSGSGPAYFYLVAEAMAEAAVRLGLSPAEAELLARQTLVGAGAMLEGNEKTSPADLRAAVTSPQGTTEAAIKQMRRDGLENLFLRGMQACVARGQQMGEELENAP